LKLSNKEQNEETEDEQEEATEHVSLFVVPPQPRRGNRRVQARKEVEQADEAPHGSEDDDSDYNEAVILDSDYGITWVRAS
jgi:hypothetical protein